jgi:hypothetical protein
MSDTVYSLEPGGVRISMETERETDAHALRVAEFLLAGGKSGLVLQRSRRVGSPPPH